MTYTVLKPDLSRVGLLANTGSSPNQFWDDKITQGIAEQSDSLSSSDLASDISNKNLDLSGNTKQWIHTLDSLNVSTLDPVGSELDVGYHVAYYDESSNRNYLMTLTKVTEDATGHAKNAIGVNTAVYDMNGIRLDAKTFDETTGTLNNILEYVFAGVPWNIRLQSSNTDVFAFEIKQDDTVQSVLQSVVTLFGVEVDAFMEPVTGTTTGALIFGNANAIKRVIVVADELGSDKQIPVVYGHNMTSLSKTTVSDVFGTRFKVIGADDLTIESVNNGSPYLVDDVANQQHNPIGWANGTYRDLIITNNAIKDAKALLNWGKSQVEQLNHPRANYEVSALFSDGIALGDSIIVQDLYAGTPIVVKSRAIKIQSSQANPYNLTVTIGEFVDISRRTNVMTSVLEIANSAKTIAIEAQSSATVAQSYANTAQATASVASSSAKVAQSMANTVSSSVAAAVDSAVAQAQSMDATLNQSINNSINETMSTVNNSLAVLDSEASSFKSAADSATSSVASSVSALMTTTTASLAVQGSNAVSTANQALANASSVAVSAASANSTANSNATKALSQASSTATSVAAAASIANSNATKAVASAGTAITNANTALSSASSALTTANASSLATSSVASDVNGLKANYTSLNSSAGVLTSQTASLAVSASSASAQFDKVSSATGSLSAETAALKVSASSASAEFTKVNSSADSLAADTASLKVSASSAALSIGSVQSSAGSLASDAASLKVSASSAALSVSNLTSSAGSLSAKTASLAVSASSFATAVTSMSSENGSQATALSSLVQRADGFDLTVSKVNNLSVGGRNLFVLATASKGWLDTSYNVGASSDASLASDFIPATGNATYIAQQWYIMSHPTGGGYLRYAFYDSSKTPISRVPAPSNNNATYSKWVITTPVNTAFIRMSFDYTDNNGSKVKFEKGNMPTDWTPAPEDVDAVTGSLASDTSSLKLSASSAALDISHVASSAGSLAADTASLKVSASSAALSISSTQSTASSTATQATSLAVSASSAAVAISNVQSSAGSLSAETSSLKLSASSAAVSIGNVQSSAGSLATETAALKVSASSASAQFDKVNSSAGSLATQAASLAVSASSAAIGISNVTSSANSLSAQTASLAVSASSFATTVTSMSSENGTQSTAISKLTQRADGFDMTVAKVDNLSTGDRNYILDTAKPKTQTSNGKDNQDFYSSAQFYSPIKNWGVANGDYIISFDWTLKTALSSNMTAIVFFNQSPWQTQEYTIKAGQLTGHVDLKFKLYPGILTATNDVSGLTFRIMSQMASGNTITYSNLFMKSGTITTTWSPAPEDTEAAFATQKITIDGITDIVSNPTTGLSVRVQKAEGFLNTVKGIDIPALQKATFWQPYSSLNFNDYTSQGSFFFNTTSAKTNGPTTSNAWIYLMVEQGVSDNSRIKQTAWYDGVNGVKITYVRTLNSGTWSSWYANDNDSVATISVMNGQIKQEVSDRTTGDSNTLTQAKSFTTSQITTYDTGIQSQFTQTSDSFIATLSAINQVVDSSLTNGLDMWRLVDRNGNPSPSRFYATTNVSYQGVASIGYSQTTLSGNYTSISTQVMTKNGWQASTINVSVDVQARTIGTSDSDYLIIYLSEWDSSGAYLTTTNITGTISTSNGNWVNYRKKITLNTNTAKTTLTYQMRGNGNVYISRPYVGVNELPEGAYVEGPVTSSSGILALTANNYSFGINSDGKLVSGMSGNEELLTLTGKAIHLDGETTVDGDFYAKGGNFKNLNASNITTGTLDAARIAAKAITSDKLTITNGFITTAMIADASISSAKIISLDATKIKTGILDASLVTVKNLNASNITTGTINGTNLKIDLSAGQVVFQKGRIYSADGSTDINIDSGYISTANYKSRILLTNGQMQFVDPTVFSESDTPYFKISNDSGIFNGAGPLVSGKDNLTLGLIGKDSLGLSNSAGDETFYGINLKSNTNMTIGGANQGLYLSGGATFADSTTLSGKSHPYIFVGSTSSGGTSNGDRVYISSRYTHSPSVYQRTGSTSANVYVAADGALLRSSSASRFKLNIEYETDASTAEQLLTLNPATWDDKFETEQTDRLHETGEETDIAINKRRYYGIIAEDLVKANLDYLVQRNEQTNEVDGVEYAKIGVALIPIVRELRDRINEQALEIERLKEITK